MWRTRPGSILDGAAAHHACGASHRVGAVQPRLGLALLWLVGTLGAAGAAPHHYTLAERYAGCLFGETIPLMRRGLERERALETASARCAAWGDGLPAAEIRAVEAEARRAVERFERQGP